MDSVDMMNEVDTITADAVEEQVKAEKEANLLPEGTFDGLAFSWSKTPEEEKGENSPYKGVSLYRVGIKFFDCPEMGKSQTGFFSFTPTKVLNEKGRPRVAYTTLVGMVKSLTMQGKPIPAVMEQAKVTRLKYKVGQFTTGEGNTINFLKAVSVA